MPTIRELFKKEVKGLTRGLYGKSKIYIESQGAINPPRLKALLLSSPNAIADLVGITVAAALGVPIGHANRPSDTIFRSNFFLAKPIVSLLGPLAQRNLPNLIRPGRSYYVKQTPAPYQVINQIKDGISTDPLGTMLRAGRNELRDGTIRDVFRRRKAIDDKFGVKYQHLGTRSKPLLSDKKFTNFVPVYKKNPVAEFLDKYTVRTRGNMDAKDSGTTQRAVTQRKIALPATGFLGFDLLPARSNFDLINTKILEGAYLTSTMLESDLKSKSIKVPHVIFQFYGKFGKDAHIILPGTISGLSEDIEPNWNTYKYVGSPFNTYRYSGVERSIKFDLKLYSNGEASKKQLKINLDKLRNAAFPSKDISVVTTGGNDILNGYSPELMYLTISGYYKKLLGFIDGLNISVDDNVPWPVSGRDMEKIDDDPYPVVVMVSISMKVIEVVDIEERNGKKILKYNFTELPPETLEKLAFQSVQSV